MSEDLTAARRVTKRDQYRTWIQRSVGVGVAGFLAATVAWLLTKNESVLFAGLGLYWLGCLGMGIGYWHAPVSIRDELEQRMEWEASQTMTAVVVGVTVLGLPAEVVLRTTGVYTAPAAVQGALWGYLLLVVIFGLAHWHVKRQYD